MKFRALLIFAIILFLGGFFSGICMADPTVDSVSPATAAVGHEIHILGQQFGAIQDTGIVTFFDGVAADQITSWSDNEIVCQVPDGAQSGCLTVTTSEGISNCLDVTLLNLGEFYSLSGVISGIPSEQDFDIKEIRITAIETSGANLGNEIEVSEDGSYQMAIFPGTYDLLLSFRLDKWGSDDWEAQSHVDDYFIERDVVISGDTNLDLSIPIYVLSGKVTDESGTGIPGVKLDIPFTSMGSAGAYASAFTYSLNEPGSEGNYYMFLVPGTYSLEIVPSPALYPPFEIQKLHILENTTRDIVLSTDYSVLNEAIDSLPADLELHYDLFDIIDQDQSTTYEIPVTASRDEMELVVNWEGSEIHAEIFRPDGSLFGDYQSGTPPIMVNIPNPSVGIWSCRVTGIDVPYENYPIAVVAGITPNKNPIAVANGPYTGDVGTEILLDASASYDLDGSIVRYEWDLDNDGNFDIRTIESTISHAWLAPYTGSIRLRVTDDEGVTDTDYASIVIYYLGDFEPDCDVDGADLAAYILDNRGISPADFAGNYGKVACY